MRRLVAGAEAAHALLLVLALAGPLGYFFVKVAPWQQDMGAFFSARPVVDSVLNSLSLCVVTAVASTSLAFVFSWLFWRFEWPRGIARVLALGLKLPYLIPPFFLAMGWIALAAPGVGYLNRLTGGALPPLYGLGGTIFVEVLWTTALAMIQLQAFFEQYPGQLEDAAVLCGASPYQAFRKITLPLARPYLASCLLLTSVSALSAFGIPAMLASPARTFVLTTRIYQGIKSSHDFSSAGLLSLLLMSVVIVILITQRVAARPRHAVLVGGKASRPARLLPSAGSWTLFLLACVFGLLSFVLPFGAIIVQSLLRDPSDLASWGMEKYVQVFTALPDSWIALRNSLITSLCAAFAATFLGLVLSYGSARLYARPSKLLTEAWNVGYGLPGTVIALALMVFYAGSLTDTLWILILAYLAKYAAFALRTLTPAMASVGRELEEAAWMSGASPRFAFWRILVPMLKPALAAALLLAMVPMLSELTMSVLLVGAGTDTLGSLIFKLQEYADPGSAAVLAVVVTVVIFAANLVLRRISKGAFGI